MDALVAETGETVTIRGTSYTGIVADVQVGEAEDDDAGGLTPTFGISIVFKLGDIPDIDIGEKVVARGKTMRLLRKDVDEASIALICDNPQAKSK